MPSFRTLGLGVVLVVALSACGASATTTPGPTVQVAGTPTGTPIHITAAPTTAAVAPCIFEESGALAGVTLVFPNISTAVCAALDLPNTTRTINLPAGSPDCTATLGGQEADVYGDTTGEVCGVFNATPTPTANSNTVSLGDPVGITCSGADCMTVSVDKVAFAKFYRDPAGFLNDTPSTKGDLFMAYHVTYKATGPEASYNEFDWAVYVNDQADDVSTFVEHGPAPTLNSGQLPVGKSAAGWIVQEVPPTGQIIIAYQPGSNGDIFEVVARSK